MITTQLTDGNGSVNVSDKFHTSALPGYKLWIATVHTSKCIETGKEKMLCEEHRSALLKRRLRRSWMNCAREETVCACVCEREGI